MSNFQIFDQKTKLSVSFFIHNFQSIYYTFLLFNNTIKNHSIIQITFNSPTLSFYRDKFDERKKIESKSNKWFFDEMPK